MGLSREQIVYFMAESTYLGGSYARDYRNSRRVGCSNLTNRILSRPWVGAVVLSEKGEIIGKGYKQFLDDTNLILHAERVAIEEALINSKRDSLGGATLLTTLEPCYHEGEKGLNSCSHLIVERGIKKVIFGLEDLSMQKKGVKYLQKCGVKVEMFEGLNETITRELMRSPKKTERRLMTNEQWMHFLELLKKQI